MAQISLSELADLSIGTPETGHVNFTALHTLLHAIIKHLNLQDLQTEMREEPAPPPGKGQPCEAAPLYADLEKKVAGVEAQVQDVAGQLQGLEKQLSALEKLPSGLDLLQRAKSGAQNGSAVADMWQMMQMKKRIEANENGVSKSMSLLQDLLNEVNGVKMAQAYTDNKIKKMKEKLGWLNPQEVDSQLQLCFMDQKNLNTDLKSLEQRLSLYPSPEELSNLVRWEILEDCLVTNKGKTPPSASQSVETIIGQTSLTRHPGLATDTHARKAPVTGVGASGSQVDSLGTAGGTSRMQTGSPGTQESTPAVQTKTAGSRGRPPSVLGGTSETRANTTPSVAAGTTGTRASTPSMPSGSSGTRASTPSAPPGTPDTRASTPTAPADISGAQPRASEAQAGGQGIQLGSPGAGPSSPGTQAGPTGVSPGVVGTQGGAPGMDVDEVSPSAWPSAPGTPMGAPGTEVGQPGTWHGSPATLTVTPGIQAGAVALPIQVDGQAGTPRARHWAPGLPTGVLVTQMAAQAGASSTLGTQVMPSRVGPSMPGTQVTPPEAEPSAPGTQVTPTGAWASAPGTQVTPTGAWASAPGTQVTPTGAWASAPGTQVTPTGAWASAPGTQVTPTGAWASAPGTQVTPTGAWAGGPETQVMPSGAWASASGTQVTPPEAGPSVPGTQVAPPGAWAGMPETQVTLSVAWTGAPGTQVMPPGAWAGVPETQVTPPRALAGAPETHVTSPGAWPSASGTPVDMPVPQTAAPAGPPGDWTGAPSTPLAIPGTQAGPPVAQPSMSGPQAGSLAPPLGTSALQPMAPAASSSSATQLVVPSGSYVTQTPLAASPEQKDKLGATASFPRESSASSSTASRYSETMEALRQMGQLSNLYAALKEQVNQLEETKCTYSDLSKLKQLLLETARKNVPSLPAAVLDQLSSLKDMAEDMRSTKEKIINLQNVLEGAEVAGAGQSAEESGQINLQVAKLRSTVKNIEKELRKLREKQDQGKAKLEQSVTDTALCLQDQLDKLRSVIEGMMASSSTLLSMSMPAGPETTEAALHASCPACSIDVSEQVSHLFKRYEQLQDLINSFMKRRTQGKASKRPQLKSQDEELLNRIQSTIINVQEDCEKLNTITGNLIEEHRQKQKDIDVLFQSLEKLEKEKADKEHLEMEIDVKADKISLASKVSRSQFDATLEQLNKMIQDLLNKMTGHEQDWHKVLDKLVVEMDSKLDRLELDPFREQLEERWKAIRKQLKEKSPQYEADEAAGIRKRLLAHFHCISCDRPLDMVVPGPTITRIPSVPMLPTHRSVRPYTVYELEQVRQQCRSLRLGAVLSPHADGLLLEKSTGLGRLHSVHSKMLMDIEKVQTHYGGTARASSQMIRELLQSQCHSLGHYHQRDKMAEMECGYLSVPRHCGGSHTITYPYRRYTRLQQIAHCVPGHPGETTMLAVMKHGEVDILGLDGHIYKGRMETKLPSISGKNGPLKTKSKLSQSSFQKQSTGMDMDSFPARPQSAKLSSLSNTARSLKDRPVSSQGRLSQTSLIHPPSPTQPQEERDDFPMQEKETLEFQLTVPMSQQTDEQAAPFQ